MRQYTKGVQLYGLYTEELHKYQLLLLLVLPLLDDLEPYTIHPIKTDLVQPLIPWAETLFPDLCWALWKP